MAVRESRLREEKGCRKGSKAHVVESSTGGFLGTARFGSRWFVHSRVVGFPTEEIFVSCSQRKYEQCFN